MNRDVNSLRDTYGGKGHIFADIKADPRFLEEPGQLDLVYKIKEGGVWRAAEINMHIDGEHPHTRESVVLNRVSVRPGDILDTREAASQRTPLESLAVVPERSDDRDRAAGGGASSGTAGFRRHDRRRRRTAKRSYRGQSPAGEP